MKASGDERSGSMSLPTKSSSRLCPSTAANLGFERGCAPQSARRGGSPAPAPASAPRVAGRFFSAGREVRWGAARNRARSLFVRQNRGSHQLRVCGTPVVSAPCVCASAGSTHARPLSAPFLFLPPPLSPPRLDARAARAEQRSAALPRCRHRRRRTRPRSRPERSFGLGPAKAAAPFSLSLSLHSPEAASRRWRSDGWEEPRRARTLAAPQGPRLSRWRCGGGFGAARLRAT